MLKDFYFIYAMRAQITPLKTYLPTLQLEIIEQFVACSFEVKQTFQNQNK